MSMSKILKQYDSLVESANSSTSKTQLNELFEKVTEFYLLGSGEVVQVSYRSGLNADPVGNVTITPASQALVPDASPASMQNDSVANKIRKTAARANANIKPLTAASANIRQAITKWDNERNKTNSSVSAQVPTNESEEVKSENQILGTLTKSPDTKIIYTPSRDVYLVSPTKKIKLVSRADDNASLPAIVRHLEEKYGKKFESAGGVDWAVEESRSIYEDCGCGATEYDDYSTTDSISVPAEDPVIHDLTDPEDTLDAIANILRLAGRDVSSFDSDPGVMPEYPVVESETPAKTNKSEDIDYMNQPDEVYYNTHDQMIKNSGGINKSKKMHRPAAGGDNPMAVKPLKTKTVKEHEVNALLNKWRTILK